MESTIRFAEKRDVLRIIELCELHALFEQSDYDPTGKSQQLSAQLFHERPSVFCLVAEQSDTLIGYATYMQQYATWDAAFYVYMDCLFLTEEARGKGVGEELVNRIKLEAKKSNCTHIQWQTPDFNARAIKFYKRIGAISKTKERFFLDVEVELKM